MTVWVCATCAVEYPDTEQPPQQCAICSDERQYVPPSGQRWTTLAELRSAGHNASVAEVEPNLHGITVEPSIGIGQRGLLLRTPNGNLLWEPPGYVDDAAVEQVRELGGITVVASSHPHMFGVQVEWSRAFGGAPVFVGEADKAYVQRPDPAIRFWSGTEEVLPGVTLVQCGGHFKGSAVAHWFGEDGRGVLLTGDTIAPTPDTRWVSFMRSYPNNIPLSPAAVERVVRAVEPFEFDRTYASFGNRVATDAKAVIRRSADRYIGWISGEFDADT